MLIEDERDDHRSVEQQVRLVVELSVPIATEPVRRDRRGADTRAARTSARSRRPRRRCRLPSPGSARRCSSRCTARKPMNAAGRHRDQSDLGERDKRLGLAVPEAVVVIGRNCAAMRTPSSVVRLAIRSRPLSAREPSIAIESVSYAAQAFSDEQDQRHRDAGHRGARGQTSPHARQLSWRSSRVEQPFASSRSPSRGEQAALVQAVRTVGPEFDRVQGSAGSPLQCGGRGTSSPVEAAAPFPRSAARRSRGCRAGATGPRPRRRAANRGSRLAK